MESHPMLVEPENRFTVLPIAHPGVWAMYKKAEASFWKAEEINMEQDPRDFDALDEGAQRFVKHVLAFFAGSDGIVNENLGQRFLNEVKPQEAKFFYGFQIAMENIHSETYSLMIDALVRDPEEKARLLGAIRHIPCIAKKAEWALRWIADRRAPFAQRLLAFACVEGVFFSGAFCAIYWLKQRGVMPGLTYSNELISRDESLHTEFAVLLYSMTPAADRLSEEQAHAMVREAIAVEREFILDAIPCTLLGMSAELMSEYVEFVADRLLKQLGYGPAFGARQPFEFMDMISLQTKSNFFERRVGEYSIANVGAAQAEIRRFATDADF